MLAKFSWCVAVGLPEIL